jgi:hypothetical protein
MISLASRTLHPFQRIKFGVAARARMSDNIERGQEYARVMRSFNVGFNG